MSIVPLPTSPSCGRLRELELEYYIQEGRYAAAQRSDQISWPHCCASQKIKWNGVGNADQMHAPGRSVVT